MKVSNCCGAVIDYYSWRDLYELCPKCGEHCEYIEETDLNTINTENEQDKDNKLREVL